MQGGLEFALQVMDAAWFIEIAIWALAWVVLCHGRVWKPGYLKRQLVEFLLISSVILVVQFSIMLFIGTGLYILLQIVLQGVAGALMLYFCSDSHRKARLVMWCSMLAGGFAIHSIGGQCSFLIGQFLSKGLAEGAIRCSIASLKVPLAWYLHSFGFEESERVPTSSLSALLIGDASVIAMNVLEVLWANTDYRITIIFLTAYIFLLLMILMAMRGMHDMRMEQNEIVELQAERQRLHSERELAQMTQDNLENLRSIRHDLKNQYSYMQILLFQKRYDELEEYFRQSSENLLPQLGQLLDCGNRVVNTILNMELAKARKAGVDIDHQLVVPPVLPFGEDDLCSILSNLLDNAIEECARLRRRGQENVSLRLEIYLQKSYLFLLCRNSTDRTELTRLGQGLRTTKGDERLHGHGTRIVSKIAEKYNGCAEFALSGGSFVAKVLLDMTVEENV